MEVRPNPSCRNWLNGRHTDPDLNTDFKRRQGGEANNPPCVIASEKRGQANVYPQEQQERISDERGRDFVGETTKMGQIKIATFTTTMGTFKAELFCERMPITCGNFIDLANGGFYDGIHFHRVIPRFLCQFGCPFARDSASPKCGTGGPPPRSSFVACDGRHYERNEDGGIPDEMGGPKHQISNLAGTISMANTGQPDSGGSQFFINVGDNTFLDWFEPSTDASHPVFGRIMENYNLVLQMSQVSTRNDNPVLPIRVISVRVK